MERYIITEYNDDTRINYIFYNYKIARKIYDIYYNEDISNIDYEKRKGVLPADLFKETEEEGITEDLYIPQLLQSTNKSNLNCELDEIKDVYKYGHWSKEYYIWLNKIETPFSAMKYEDYLKSDYWKILREKRLKLDNYKCKRCGRTSNLEVHHNTYIYRGKGVAKEIKNLITLCRDCHQELHDKENNIEILF